MKKIYVVVVLAFTLIVTGYIASLVKTSVDATSGSQIVWTDHRVEVSNLTMDSENYGYDANNLDATYTYTYSSFWKKATITVNMPCIAGNINKTYYNDITISFFTPDDEETETINEEELYKGDHVIWYHTEGSNETHNLSLSINSSQWGKKYNRALTFAMTNEYTDANDVHTYLWRIDTCSIDYLVNYLEKIH